MSNYSSLVLAANNDVSGLSEKDVAKIFSRCGLLANDVDDDEFGNLASHICELFSDGRALKENDRFFRPDSIGFTDEIAICSLVDEAFEGIGWSIKIHGYGYFFPWTSTELRRIVRTPRLKMLRDEVSAKFGGKFVFPSSSEDCLRSRHIDGTDGWMWFYSET